MEGGDLWDLVNNPPPFLPQDKMGSLDDLALADLLRTDLLPQMAEEVSGGENSSRGGGGCWPGIGTILGWDQQQQVEPVAGAGLQLLRSAECQYQQPQPQTAAELLDLNCGGRGEVFSDIEVSEAVDRSLAKLVSAAE